MEGEIRTTKNPSPGRGRAPNPPLQTFEMQQVEDARGGPQEQGPAFFYRDVIAISRLVASRPAGVLVPPATELEGELERERPREVQSSPLPAFQEVGLLREQWRRCQCHVQRGIGISSTVFWAS